MGSELSTSGGAKGRCLMSLQKRPMDKILRRVEINQWHYGWLETCVEKHSVPETLSYALQRGMPWQPITASRHGGGGVFGWLIFGGN